MKIDWKVLLPQQVLRKALAKFALRKAIGLYLGDREVAVSQMAATPLGPVEVYSKSAVCTSETMGSVLESLLKPILRGKHRMLVAAGLPNSRVFFGTRLTRTGGEVTAESVLQKAFSSPNIRIDDLTVDLIRGEVNKMPVASVAACRKKYMGSVIGLLTHAGVRPHCAEPEACSMVRLAAQQHRFPRRQKTVLCVFLNATHGLAVLVTGGVPLGWRQFTLMMGSESLGILSAARTLETQYKHYGIESSPDFVMIFGREDLHEQLRKDQLPSDLGTRVIWHAGPELSSCATAQGLALSCLAGEVEGFDLSRNLKPRPTIGEIFPWGDLVFVILAVICMGAILGYRYMSLTEDFVSVQTASAQHACLAGSGASHLEKDEKEMRQKIEAVRKFLENRVLWTGIIANIAQYLPDNASLNGFDCSNTAGIENTGPGRVSKSIKLRGTAALTDEGAIPREIDQFCNELRKSPVLKHDFGIIQLTDIKRSESTKETKDKIPEAAFTIIGLPKK